MAWFQPFAHALNCLLFKHMSISGRVLMTPSKSHGPGSAHYLCTYQWYASPCIPAWGGCWRKEKDLPLQCSLRGWYLARIVPIHSNGIQILFCCVKCLRKIFCELYKYPISLCPTLCMTRRYGVLVRDM